MTPFDAFLHISVLRTCAHMREKTGNAGHEPSCVILRIAAPVNRSGIMKPMQGSKGLSKRPKDPREGLTRELVPACELALRLGDTGATVDAILAIAEINTLPAEAPLFPERL